MDFLYIDFKKSGFLDFMYYWLLINLKGGSYMQEAGKKNYWSPYIAGACAGLVLVLSVWFTGKYFGASTSFVRSAGLIEKIFSAERVDQMAYFVAKTPKIEWQWMFVVGILIGALIASGSPEPSSCKRFRTCGRNASVPALPPERSSHFSAARWPCSGRVLPAADLPVMV